MAIKIVLPRGILSAWLLLFLVVSGEAVAVARNIDETTRGNNQRKFRGSGNQQRERDASSTFDLKEDISSDQVSTQKSAAAAAVLVDLATTSLHTASAPAGDITAVDYDAAHALKVKSLPAESGIIPEKSSIPEAIPEAILDAILEDDQSGVKTVVSNTLPSAKTTNDAVRDDPEVLLSRSPPCTSWTVVANEKSTYDVTFRQSHETTNVTDGSMPGFVSMAAATNGAVDAELTTVESRQESSILEEMPPAFAELTMEMDVEPLCIKKMKGTTVLRVLLRRPSVSCDHTRVFNEDRCDRDDKTDGVWLALLTKASRIPFFVERAPNGAVMSVKLASVDEQDRGVSELKRTVAQLLHVPERCRQEVNDPSVTFEKLSNGIQAVTQYSSHADPLAAHSGYHDKQESRQKVLHSTVLKSISDNDGDNNNADRPLRIVASTRDSLLQYNFADQFPEQYITRHDPNVLPSAKRRAVIRSLAMLQLHKKGKRKADADAEAEAVPNMCTLAMFGALHKKGNTLFLELEQSLTLEAQVGMANYEKELHNAANGVGRKHPPNKRETPEKFNPTDLASFRASHSVYETEQGLDRFKKNAMSLVDERDSEEGGSIDLTAGLTKGEIFAERVEQFVMIVPAMKATYSKIKKFQQRFFAFENLVDNLDNVMYNTEGDPTSGLDDWGVGCFVDFVSYMDRPPANYSHKAVWVSDAEPYMKLSRGTNANNLILQDPLPNVTPTLMPELTEEELELQKSDFPSFAPTVEFLATNQLKKSLLLKHRFIEQTTDVFSFASVNAVYKEFMGKHSRISNWGGIIHCQRSL
jgi:hypothetical protein